MAAMKALWRYLYLLVHVRRYGVPSLLFHDDRKGSLIFLFEQLGGTPWELVISGIIMKEDVKKRLRERALKTLVLSFLWRFI